MKSSLPMSTHMLTQSFNPRLTWANLKRKENTIQLQDSQDCWPCHNYKLSQNFPPCHYPWSNHNNFPFCHNFPPRHNGYQVISFHPVTTLAHCLLFQTVPQYQSGSSSTYQSWKKNWQNWQAWVTSWQGGLSGREDLHSTGEGNLG